MRHSAVAPRRSRGFVLIASLLLMVVLTILAVSMLRGFTLQQKIAGNTREKHRALEAAQSTLQYAEWWLQQSGNATGGVSCTATGSNTIARVCINALSSPTDPSTWATGSSTLGTVYTLPQPGSTNGNLIAISTTGGADTYYSNPVFYIQNLGSGNGGVVYKITAVAWGGTEDAVAVVQSTYLIGSTSSSAL